MGMTQKQWDRMTGPERAEYLNKHEIEVKTQTFIDGSAKVGEARVTVGRMAVCGGVALTDWLKDEPDTVIAAAREQIDNIADEAHNRI